MIANKHESKVCPILDARELGVCLRQQRRAQGSTIRQASLLSGLGERFISELERGKESAFLDRTLRYLSLLGLGMQIYPRNTLAIGSPYGAVADPMTLGQIMRHHRQSQNATLATVKDLSGLGLRFLSDFERGKNSRIGNVLAAFNSYGLKVVVTPKTYRLGKSDLVNVR